jgi:hypothetical protein
MNYPDSAISARAAVTGLTGKPENVLYRKMPVISHAFYRHLSSAVLQAGILTGQHPSRQFVSIASLKTMFSRYTL